MIKFIVVVYRKASLTRSEFREYFARVHGPLAEKLPGLRRYVQNFVVDDPLRKDPGWDAVIELWWDSREEMEAAWKSREGEKSTTDLENCADLSRTTWSIVDEIVRR